MAVKIGELGFGGAGLSKGHQDGGDASLKELFLAVRAELDQLYAKLNADATVTDINYGADAGVHEKQFVS